MPLLLQELVEESSKSNRWATERLDAEARHFDELLHTEAPQEKLRQTVEEVVRMATEYAITRMPQAEGLWRSGIALVRNEPTDKAVIFFQSVLGLFESGLTLIRAVSPLLKIAALLGTVPERFDELDQAEKRLLELASDAKTALMHRTSERQVSDPDRLAKGLQLAREGKTVSADEARARYSRSQG